MNRTQACSALTTLAVVALGAPVLHAQTQIYTFTGTSGDQLGRSVAPAGDVNNDGYDDVIVGSPLDDPSGVNSGKAVVYSGKTGSALLTLHGLATGDEFGYSVDGIGDIDHDGYDDVVVGAPGNDSAGNDTGIVRVYSGHTGTWLFEWFGSQDGSRFGHSVAGAGDVNDDGTRDIIVGAPYDNGYHIDGGAVRVFSGLTGDLMWTRYSQYDGTFCGWSVDGVGDIDGDGHDDFIVGMPGSPNANAVRTGRALVMSGADGFLLDEVFGTLAGDKMGWSVAGLGDVDGDSVPDFGVGAPYANVQWVDAGEVRVISGANGHELYRVSGANGTLMGASVAGVGDIDNDGHNDFMVGAPKHNFLATTDVGLVRVYSGGDGSSLFTSLGTSEDDTLGIAVAGAGDVNNDGTPDIIAGAPYANSNGPDAGYARVWLMDAPEPTGYCTAKINSLGCTPHIGAHGVPSLHTANTFHITASNVRNNKTGILFWGLHAASIPFGGGTLCVGAPIARTGPQAAGGSIIGSDCTGSYSFFFSQSYMSAMGLVAGVTVKAQYWSRDPGFAAPNNVGLTNAVSFEILN